MQILRFIRWMIPVLGCIVGTLAYPPQVASQYIYITTDPRNPVCNCYIPSADPPPFYIWLSTGLPMRGVAFSIAGFPSTGYSYHLTPHPNAETVLGDPFTGGVLMTFPSCESGDIILFTVEMVHTSGEPQVFVGAIEAHPDIPPPCPVVIDCDDSHQCAYGGQAGSGPMAPTPSNPSPGDGVENVPVEPVLSWENVGRYFCCCYGPYPGYGAVYFGTDPSPPMILENEGFPHEYRPGELQPNTTYYWQIDYSPSGGCADSRSPVWSFSTGGPTTVESLSWEAVKRLYRD